ncbi:MAG: hypothetical protein R2867_43150 [Caldilineaceae bacterium]
MDGAFGNFEPVGQIAGGQSTVDLEQQHNRNETVGYVDSFCSYGIRRNPMIITQKYDKACLVLPAIVFSILLA